MVLVWRLDRWGRSVTDLLATLQELEHLGVGFVSLTEALDLTTPAGRAMAGLLLFSPSLKGRSFGNEPGRAWRMRCRTGNGWAERRSRDPETRPCRGQQIRNRPLSEHRAHLGAPHFEIEREGDVFSMKQVATAIVFILATIAGGQEHSTTRRHWQLTDSETLWAGRYSNCQYGYYVVLPTGVIAHAEHPPSPHHGFLIGLPDVGAKTEVSAYDSNRYAWVNAEYNVTDESTLAGISDYHIDLISSDKKGFKLLERHKTVLRSIPATRFKGEYDTPKGRVIEEEVVALRTDIVYEVGLRTPAEDYAADRKGLERTLTGFRLSRVPKGQCWNY